MLIANRSFEMKNRKVSIGFVKLDVIGDIIIFLRHISWGECQLEVDAE